MRLADFRETLSHGVEFSRAAREPRAFRRKATFFMRLSLYRSGFFHLTARIECIYTRYKAGNIVLRRDEHDRKIHARVRVRYYSRDVTRLAKNPLAPTKLTILMEY